MKTQFVAAPRLCKSIFFKTLVLFFGIAGVGTKVSFAESGWFWQNPLPQGNNLRAVAILDKSTIVAVGGFGTILRTSDGGATWVRQPSGTTRLLRGVSLVDEKTGTSVGEFGTLL